ncbi:MAG: RIP metalloprotease RseP [Spirochaetales bacterium]|nr:RIP metalloprotease RseP [Spirochaetales bacterium]
MFLNIIIGLLGLSIVVFVHEFGHLLGAKAGGIEVEAFSIGWGKKIAGFTWRGTEYLISLIPMGGYCRMKGEKIFQTALDNKEDEIPREKGSLFGVHPGIRIFTYFAGPLGNFIFSIFIMAVVWMIGFSTWTYENKIVMASDYAFEGEDILYPADRGGMETGDRIIQVDNREITNFSDFQNVIAPSPGKPLAITVERDGFEKILTVTPELDTETGLGRIGVSAWVPAKIGYIESESAADIAGLMVGDDIIEVDGRVIEQQLDIIELLQSNPLKLKLKIKRGSELFQTDLIPHYTESGQASMGIGFQTIEVLSRTLNPFKAIAKGTNDTFQTLFLTVKSMGLLFKGIDLNEAVSGPIRITYFVGEVATRGFTQGIAQGLTSFFRFLSLISVALFFMNLLPIPMLDGGMILVNFISMFKKKGINPKYFYRYQMVGLVLLLVLILFTTFNDISFFLNR